MTYVTNAEARAVTFHGKRHRKRVHLLNSHDNGLLRSMRIKPLPYVTAARLTAEEKRVLRHHVGCAFD